MVQSFAKKPTQRLRHRQVMRETCADAALERLRHSGPHQPSLRCPSTRRCQIGYQVIARIARWHVHHHLALTIAQSQLWTTHVCLLNIHYSALFTITSKYDVLRQ